MSLESAALKRVKPSATLAVDANSAGYTVTALCHSKAGMRPSRLTISAPDKATISLLTISGGPFTDAVALQRCAAE